MSKGIYIYIDKKDDSIVYVGKDSNIHEDKRHKDHFYPSMYDKQVINRVVQNNPDRYIYQRLWEIEDCSDNYLNEMEKYYTKIYDPKLSFTEGGDGTSGYKWTDEQKENLSKAMKGENHPLYNKEHTKETKIKMSKTTSEKYNTTGFYRVSMRSCPACKKGFTWVYFYYVNSQRKSVSSTNLNTLKEKVETKGLPWKILDDEKAKQSLKKDNKNSERQSKQHNTTGFYRVSRKNSSSYKKGFSWRYRYCVNSQRKSISSTNLNKLKEKVLNRGLEWQIIDENKAKQSLKEDMGDL